MKDILDDPRNKDFLSRLIEAINRSPDADKYYDKLLQSAGPDFFQEFSKGFSTTEDMLSALDKVPAVSDKVDEVLEKKYQTAKENLDNSEESRKKLKQAILYSISSKLKRNFYTDDNKFSTKKGETKLSEEDAADLTTKMNEYDDNSDKKLFTGVRNSNESTEKGKVIDFFSDDKNKPPSAVD